MLINVIVPRLWWNSLIYEWNYDFIPENGSRVLVPLGKSDCIGFVYNSENQNQEILFEIRSVKKFLDNGKKIIPDDLWDLAIWLGKTYLCGTGLALKMIFPENFLNGDEVEFKLCSELCYEENKRIFSERNFFCPIDSERYEFFVNEFRSNKKILMLFPLKETAKKFYSELPDDLKNDAILWQTSKKSWDCWKSIYKNDFRIVIGHQSAVFAPFQPEKIFVDDEANPSYIFQRTPQASARSLAGKRALLLNSEFITCGRMPSLKTFSRSKLNEKKYFIDKKFFVIVDSNYSFKESEKGIEGEMFLTYSLIERSQKELVNNKNVLWILDRFGEAGEIFCNKCGESLTCKKCGGILRTEKNNLRCISCGKVTNMPSECEHCGSKDTFFSGKRPGLDVLKKIADKYFQNVALFDGKKLKFKNPCLILGTNALLNFCDNYDIGLIAWLDIDNELRRPDYNARFNIFRLLWDSYWRNRKYDRTVLIQARNKGLNFAVALLKGWQNFLTEELRLREELFLPPYALIVEIRAKNITQKQEIINDLEKAGIFVMDSGEGNIFSISVKNPEPVRKILEKFFFISELKKMPSEKIFAE